MKTKMGFYLHHESIHSSHLLVVLLVMFFVEYASAQSNTARSPPPPAQSGLPIQTVIIILVSMLLVLFFILYMAYLKQCIDGRNSTTTATTTTAAAAVANGTDNTNPTRPRNPKGVDKSVIDTFPIIDYSAIKGLRTSKCPLECAVCLSEFENDDTLRILPGCRHVFHPVCIDTWLTDHATCPVCRSNLADPTVLAGKRTLSVNLDSEIFFGEPYVSPREETSKSTEVSRVEEIRRSHSIAEGWERYTLTLPDEVLKQIEITGRKHRRSVSVQDYTYQGKASWREGRLWAVLRSVSTTRQRRREDQTVDMVAEGTEVSVSNSAASSRRLIGYSRRVDSEISGIGSSRLEMDLNDLPVCNRV